MEVIKLSGSPVQIGDEIYDIAIGRGEVSHVGNETIEVLFDDGRRISFNKYGQLNGVRRLFWQYPILVEPPKEKQLWTKLSTTILSIYKMLRDF